jgi:nucleoside-diphosphate-sugar epimerase
MRALLCDAALAERPLSHAMVLGGSGFLGAPLVTSLVEGGARVTCLAHRRAITDPRVRVVGGSVQRFAWRELEGDPPDVLFHLARIPGRGGAWAPLTRARNRAANERLRLWLASCPKPPLLVYVGGTLVYGSRGDEAVSEDATLSPFSFARHYHAAEVPWLAAMRYDDLPVVIVRPAWVLGPGSWFEAYYLGPMRREGAVPLYGDGRNLMSIVHVDDCAGLLAHIARHAAPGAVVNAFTGPAIPQREFAARLGRLAGLPVRAVSLRDLERRHGRAAREAFVFSANITSVHASLHATYEPIHADLDGALASLLRSAGTKDVQPVLPHRPERGAV